MKNHPRTGEKINSLVPCGKCLGCLNEKRNAWTFRLLEEKKQSKNCFFLTLTYNDKHIPKDGKVSVEELQLYFKRVRKSQTVFEKSKLKHWKMPIESLTGISRYIPKSELRYFAVGEYGDKFGRPHYHAIVFNVYKSVLESKWKDPETNEDKGYVKAYPVTQPAIHYVTKYSLKPNENIMICSKGLGESYITDESKEYHLDLLEMNGEIYLTYPGGKKQTMPRYYKEKIFTKEQCLAYGEQLRQEMNELFLTRNQEQYLSENDLELYYQWLKEQKKTSTNKQYILTKKLERKR